MYGQRVVDPVYRPQIEALLECEVVDVERRYHRLLALHNLIIVSNRSNYFFVSAFSVFFAAGDLRSKKGFFDETDIGMANTISASPSSRMRRAAQPAENITRVSTRISVAAAQADPIAIPTSTPFIMQGACAGFAAQVG